MCVRGRERNVWGCPRGVMVKAMDCGIVVREFILQSRYYIRFSGKYPWERYEPPYPPSYGLNSTTKLDGNYTRMLRAILNKSWRQHPTRHQLYGHLPPITKTIQVRRTRHAGHCWRSRDELIGDVLLWTPTHGRAKAGRPA